MRAEKSEKKQSDERRGQQAREDQHGAPRIDSAADKIDAWGDQLMARAADACNISMADCARVLEELEREEAECRAQVTSRDECPFSGAKHLARDLARESEERARKARQAAMQAERDQREAERAELAAKQKTRMSEVLGLAVRKEYAVPTISALICRGQAELTGLRAELARERQIAAKGGVTDLGQRRAIAERMQEVEEEMKSWRDSLRKAHRAAPLPCNRVRATVACLRGERECSDEDALRRDISMFAEPALRAPPLPEDLADQSDSSKGVKVRSSEPVVSGRLQPEVIKAIVLQSFGTIRSCYEKALGRDPKLAGRISARFVIGRDGSVAGVSNAGSTIDDQSLVACVLSTFYVLTFPQPEGGIVTVVYPIDLSVE